MHVVPPPTNRSAGGFTLTELLVVITIVAILAAILMSVYGKLQVTSLKAKVAGDMKSLKVAVISYYTDNRRYPINDIQKYASENNSLDDTVYGDPGGTYKSRDLFNILRAQSDDFHNQNDQLNASGTVYWNGADVKNPSKPLSGITTADYSTNGYTIYKGGLVDPWGHEYVVWFDINHDGDLSTAAHWFYTDVDPTPENRKVHPGDEPMGFEIGSLGPDGKFGKNGNNVLAGSDDIVTW